MLAIWNIFKSVFLYIFRALDTTSNSASLRKLTAVWILILATIAHYRYVSQTNIDYVILIDYTFTALLLGLVTVENILYFFGKRNKTKKEPESDV